jgi:hypothetical protein
MNHWNRKKRKLSLRKQLAFLGFVSILIASLGAVPEHFTHNDSVLKITERLNSEIMEVSGMTLVDKNKIYSIGDNKSRIEVFTLTKGRLKNHKIIDFSETLNKEFSFCSSSTGPMCKNLNKSLNSQWEGISRDGAGNNFLLREFPGAIIVFDKNFETVKSLIKLDYTYSKWKKKKKKGKLQSNSSGEGLILLENGHILVVKESHPSSVIEFGPKGDEPFGFSEKSLLKANDGFEIPNRRSVYHVLKVWKLPRMQPKCDASEITVGPNSELFLLSQSCKRIYKIANLEVKDKRMKILNTYNLPSIVSKPESLVVADNYQAIVGSDSKKSKKVIYSFMLNSKPTN